MLDDDELLLNFHSTIQGTEDHYISNMCSWDVNFICMQGHPHKYAHIPTIKPWNLPYTLIQGQLEWISDEQEWQSPSKKGLFLSIVDDKHLFIIGKYGDFTSMLEISHSYFQCSFVCCSFQLHTYSLHLGLLLKNNAILHIRWCYQLPLSKPMLL
jgi:hypothetical protein